MLIAYFVCISKISMTDSMNFGPEWLRNLSSEGSSTGGSAGGVKYQLADHRYGREEMLALFEKGLPAPSSLTSFSTLYSEQQLTPLALLPQSEEERSWQSRPIPPGTLGRGRGNSLERGRISRGRGGYQSYTRPGYEGSGGWGNGEHSEWSPRKEYSRTSSVDNWRRNRGADEEDGWRSRSGNLEKWGRSASWRESGDNADDRGAPPDRMNRGSWHEGPRGPPHRRQWGDSEDHLPEWATENPSESGGSFDASGAFHGSDDEQREQNSSSRGFKKEPPLQKSASANNMSDKLHQANSQSLKSLLKQTTEELTEKEESILQEKGEEDEKEPVKENVNASKKMDKSALEPEKDPPKTDKSKVDVREINAPVTASKADDNLRSSNRVDEDFDRLQEDLVQKLVVEEDLPNKQNLDNFGLGSGHGVTHPPPNLVPPVQNSWFYQDPQGDLQGPFSSTEMAEWHKAGYFSNALLVKRQCDESFYRLGDLVSLCGGNPFLSPKPIPPLKSDVSTNVTKQLELLQRQLALNQATAMRTALGQNEFWTNLNVLQQRELLAQHMIPQPQMAPDLRYLQAASNPLMQMFNQIQQTNKLPGQPITDKPTPPIPPQLDPIQSFIQQMGGTLPTIPNPLQAAGTTHVGGLPPNNNGLPPNLHVPPAGLSFPNIPLAAAAAAAAAAASSMPSVGMQGIPTAPTTLSAGGTTSNVPHNLPPRPNPLGAVDPLSSSGASTENDPIKSLLRQLQNNKPQQPTAQTAPIDTLWQSNQQYGAVPPKSNAQSQWLPQQSNDATSASVWDLQGSTVVPMTVAPANASSPAVHDVTPPTSFNDTEIEKEFIDKKKRQKEEENAKKAKEEKEKARELEEQKKKRELEEKKRKEEQRKQEAEKKAAEERRKKEEEKIRKELEKAKREAEEKRLRELDEKRRLKEQRKAEEEAKKRTEEKRQQDEERARQEAREKEEYIRKQQEEKAKHENSIRVSRAAPWSQASPASVTGTSLAEIQRLEKEKKQEQLLHLQKQQQLLQEQQQLSGEKVSVSTMPLGWAKQPPATKKIKSLAEIQMEEQERLVKQATEARLAQIKEKEANPSTFVNATAWKGISWAIAASQWNTSGFWEETSTPKSSTQTKPSSTSTKNAVVNNQSKQASSKQSKSKAKKEEQQVMKLFGGSANSTGGGTGGNNKQDEFMEWCTKTLCKIEASIDIETFVEFLRNVESALEVRDYCKEYLGDSPSTSHFATQFLEKRRLTKPKNTTQKDDMSSPAPAITPSSHLTDFQEVKGKGKKTKKSKMTKMDKSILGFSVTAAPDRINVGDRDYVEN
ncbi:GIGYF family protein CG11148 isoform X2 [Agrilus planipennis]|uniref:GIGYF family protein CG11148 isoform X2 n=1 Tax=Agrilus planipennis TaxID=224129 RepID=A0A1W4XCA4_AGRPL|nr:GIGYF family protein CG11148 isoform X2 [Agrilus planipennis]